MVTTKLDFLSTLDPVSEPREGSWQSVLEPSDTANLGAASTLAENRAPNIWGAMEIPFTPPFDTELCNPFIFLFVSDLDEGDEITLRVTLDAPFKGVLRNFTVGSYDEATGVYTFKATASEASTALRSLRFDPRDRNGVGGIETTKITVTVTDSAGLQAERSGEIRVQTTSNQLPTLTLPTEIQVVADTGIISPFAGVSIADPEDDTLTVTIWVPPDAGVLFREEADGSRTEIDTLTGKAVDVQAAIRALKFDPADRGGAGDYAQALSFSIGVHDGTRRIGKDHTIYVTTEGGTASAAPGLSLPTVKELPVLDTQTVRPFANINIIDDSTFVTVTITFDPAKGRLLEDTTLDPIVHNGVFIMTDTPENVLRILQGLRFGPRDRVGDPDGSLETTIFTITVQDGEHTVENSEMTVHSERGGVLPPPPDNSAPTDINISSLKVAELSAENTLVGALRATDPNTGDTFTFRLLDDAGGRFKIDGNQLKVTNGVRLDFEQAPTHQIKVLVTDQAGASFEKVFTIDVTDVNPEVMSFGSAANDVIKASKTGDFKDVLNGGAGNDSLWGGYGNDKLTGGTGSDVFVFDGKLGTSKTDRKVNFDTITDYNVKEDAIWLEGDLFKSNKKLYAAIKKGTEAAPAKLATKFFALDRAKDGNDYFVYDTKKRVLSYDSDGSGSKAAIELATFVKNANLKNFKVGELLFI